jgi:hypothetical protein
VTDAPDSPEEQAVRRLLADARHTGPVPDDVAARLDAVLADLAAEPARGTAPEAQPERGRVAGAPAPVHPVVASLAAQRRRRAAGMLVAAAAIVVGGVVVAQHLPTTSNSQSTASADAAGRGEADSSLGGDTGSSTGPVAPGTSGAHDQLDFRARIRGGRVLVRPELFTADASAARRLLRQREAPASAYVVGGRARVACVAPRIRGSRVGATYQGAPAVLVFHAPESGSQVVDLYVCGSDEPLRSATLPSP